MPKALLLTLALAVGVGLAWSAAQAQPARRDVIVGLIQEPDVLNSVTSTTGATNAVLKAMMDFPVKYDPNWRITPNLITRVPTVENGDWVVRPDGTMQVTWRLRRGARWHSGLEVTAEDAAFTFRVGRHPQVGFGSTFSCGFGDKVASVEAADRYTVVVNWRQIYPFANACMIDGGLISRNAAETYFAENPAGFKNSPFGKDPQVTVGNGPFVYKRWLTGVELVLEANPTYWRGKPKMDRVTFRIFSDANVMLTNLISGAIDVIPSGFFGLQVGQAIQIEELTAQGRVSGIKIETGPSLSQEALHFNLDNPILADKRVRQALAYASNRDAIVQAVFKGKQPVMQSPVPSNHPGYLRGIKEYKYNPEQAKKLLEEAGWKPGPDGIRQKGGERLRVVITTTSGNRDRERVQQILQENWRQVGVEPIIENFPSRVVFGSMFYQRRYKGMILSSLGFNQPELNLDRYLTATARPVGERSDNIYNWRHPQADKVLQEYNRTISESKRLALLRDFQKIWAEELPTFPIHQLAAVAAYRDRLMSYKEIGFAAYPEPFTWNIFEWAWR